MDRESSVRSLYRGIIQHNLIPHRFWFKRFGLVSLVKVNDPSDEFSVCFSMTSFPWQIDRVRLPMVSTLSRRLHTLPLPEMHAAVGIPRTKRIALRNP